jgi:hypothetical protein
MMQPAFAIPVNTLPTMMVVVWCAEPETTLPTSPRQEAAMMNHFLPRRSLRKPRTGPKARVTRKFALAIQGARLSSPRAATWKWIVVFVWRIQTNLIGVQRRLTYGIGQRGTNVGPTQRKNCKNGPPFDLVDTARLIFDEGVDAILQRL